MAFVNSYTPEEYQVSFNVTDGKHHMVIRGARIVQSKTGKQMLEIGFGVKEGEQIVKTTYVERLVEGEYFNKSMTRLFDAFKIPRGNFDFKTWVGKIGYAEFCHKPNEWVDEYSVTHTSQKCEVKFYYTDDAQVSTSSTPAFTPKAVPAGQAAQAVQAAQVIQNTFDGAQVVDDSGDDGFPEDIPF